MRMRAGRLSVARHEKTHPEVRKRDRHAGPLRGSRRHLIRGRDDLRQRRPERLAEERRRQERVAEEPGRRQRVAHRQRPEERLAARGRLQGGRPTDRLARPMDPHLDATAQADLVRAGEVSPRELVESSIERIEALNGDLNAVIHPLFDQALETEPADGPFRGVPLVVKDLICSVAGTPQHEGMRFLKELDFHADEDSWLAARFRKAGFVFVGKSNTPELGILPTTEPLAYGASRNPWDTSRSTGGSSGGSGAAVASGMVSIGHASDGGGSIRIPASCCGLVGLKATRGRVSLAPIGDFASGLATELVVSRSVRDTAAVLEWASATAPPGEPYFAPARERPYPEEVGADPGALRIGLMTAAPGGHAETHPDCVAAA